VDFEGFNARLSTIFFKRFGSFFGVDLGFSSSELSPSSPSSRFSLSPVLTKKEEIRKSHGREKEDLPLFRFIFASFSFSAAACR
jgi:hypothetical protein